MKKKKANIKPLIITFILILMVFGSLFIFNDTFTNEEDEELVEKEDVIKNKSLSFTFAGNVLINSEMWYDTLSKENYDFTFMFEDLNDVMKKSDVNAYFEQSIIGGSDLKVSSNSSFNTPKEILKAVSNVGFNHISFASTHAFDKGENGIKNTISYLNESKLSYSGISDGSESNNILDVNGVKVGFLSYTTRSINDVSDNSLVSIYSEDLVKSDIEKLKVDVIVVFIDWSEYQSSEINDKQKEIAKTIADLGADIIIGNNDSLIEPIEMIDDTLVCYSLGNLMSGHSSVDSRISSIVDFKLSITSTNGEISKSFEDINVLFTYGYNDDSSSYKIIPFSKINNELSNVNDYYTKYSEIVKGIDTINIYSIGE